MRRDDGTADEPRTPAEWERWVPAGGMRNWCAGDLLLDWLDRYGTDHGFMRDELHAGYDERFDFGRYVAARARAFEERAIAYLGERVALTRIGGEGARALDDAHATVDAIERGDEAIAGGVLRDAEHAVYGRADLLVHWDVLRQLWPSVLAAEPEALPWAPERHYRVVEIKYTSLKLLKDGSLSAGEHRAHMLQAWAYNRALGRIQGYTPPSSYLLGRGWQRDGKAAERGDDAWERLGVVPTDRAIRGVGLSELFAEYAAWIRRLRAEGAGWRALPVPSLPELWPDMGGDERGGWHEAKRRLAEELGELTLLWQVGTSARVRAHAAGITRWDDARLDPEVLGIGEGKRETLEAMLAVNVGDGPSVRPARIRREGWREPASVELYVDFETVNHLRDDLSAFPRRGGQSLIFQIGCGRMVDGSWRMAQFTARSLDVAGEAEMLDRWLAHLRELASEAGVALAEVRLFHWSAAETSMLVTAYDSARHRHPEREWPELGWFDLLERVVRAEPVVVRGALGFGLKKVGHAMAALGLIETDWTDSVADGTGAMAGAWSAADEAQRTGAALEDVDAMREVARYNEIDCRVMAEVLAYLRRAH